MNYIYSTDMPECIKTDIEKKFESFENLWPGWVQDVIIHYLGNELQGAALSCEPDFKYRLAHVNIYDNFLREKDWEIMIFHEMFHVFWSPYTTHIESVIENFIKDEDVLTYLREQLAYAEEGITQDFAKLASTLYLTKYNENVIIQNNEK